ncbi:hypothetical protein EPHNCH_0963 [Anaplasma phagocytophilum str. NCH-1]|uniref:Uncharacterized protein n=1 Tax=Anaplasma phagocytophilum str. NCH-1 TaxID=1359161 RepID=A0A0F3NC43_ANAPH|nr:hypothetical protein EPHNCH_0963 [Anaplasma phagocytophilum str. NCH-1]
MPITYFIYHTIISQKIALPPSYRLLLIFLNFIGYFVYIA